MPIQLNNRATCACPINVWLSSCLFFIGLLAMPTADLIWANPIGSNGIPDNTECQKPRFGPTASSWEGFNFLAITSTAIKKIKKSR